MNSKGRQIRREAIPFSRDGVATGPFVTTNVKSPRSYK